MAAPATADWEGNGQGQLDHALFASFRCFVPGQISLGNMIYPYLVLFNPFLDEICRPCFDKSGQGGVITPPPYHPLAQLQSITILVFILAVLTFTFHDILEATPIM